MNHAFLPDGFSLTNPDSENDRGDETTGSAADSTYPGYPDQDPSGLGWLPYLSPPVPLGLDVARPADSQPSSDWPTFHATPTHDARAAAAARYPLLASGSPCDVTPISASSYQQLSVAYRGPSLAFAGPGSPPAYRSTAEFDVGPPNSPPLPLLQAELGGHVSWRAADRQDGEDHEHGTPQQGGRAGRTTHKRKTKGKERITDRHAAGTSQAEGAELGNSVAQGRSRQGKPPFAPAPASFIDLAGGEASIACGQVLTPLPTPNSSDAFTAPTTPSTAIASVTWSPLSETPTTDSVQVSTWRARNRAASLRCRAKVKAASQELEDEAWQVEARNRELIETREGLKEVVWRLNMELLDHHACGDELIDTYIQKSAQRRVKQKLREGAVDDAAVSYT